MQNLSRLDLVGIGQLVFVQLEDLHVGAGVSEVLFGNGARVAANGSPVLHLSDWSENATPSRATRGL